MGRARLGPTPGPSTNHYGGNTSWVEVTLSDGTLLVLAAGSGTHASGPLGPPVP